MKDHERTTGGEQPARQHSSHGNRPQGRTTDGRKSPRQRRHSARAMSKEDSAAASATPGRRRGSVKQRTLSPCILLGSNDAFETGSGYPGKRQPSGSQKTSRRAAFPLWNNGDWSGRGEDSSCLPILFASASSPFSSPGDPKALQTNAVTGFRSLVLASTRQLNQQSSSPHTTFFSSAIGRLNQPCRRRSVKSSPTFIERSTDLQVVGSAFQSREK